MEAWYQNRFRRTLLDMHIEDWNSEFLSQYDPEVYFKALKKAEINAPMIYAHSHVGLCYWPTKTGDMHKAFIGREDQMRKLFDLCHEEGMDVVLYYSLIFNNREYDKHPDWRMRDFYGQGSRDHGARYGLCCPNNLDYREFVKQQIREFSDYFDFEGVFFDMTFWPEVCYCDSCKKRWEEEIGGEMPSIVDWNDKRWVQFNKKRHEWLGEFARFVTAEAKSCKSGVTVEHQYSTSLAYWRFGNNENISLASDYIGTDLYGGIKQQSFACKAWYNLTMNQPFQYMTSRCYPALSEHTTMKSYDQLKQCVAMTYLHHGASLLIDAIDPIGTIDERVYELIGSIYRETRPYEKYLTRGTMTYDVSLYFNLNGKMNTEANGYSVMDHKLDRGALEGGTIPQLDALMGAWESLVSHHIPFGIVNNWKIDELKNHKVLILSDVPFMEKRETDIVRDYIKNGGNVYMSGHSAPELLEEIFGLKSKGYTEETITYMAPADKNGFMGDYFTKKYPLVMFEKSLLATGDITGEVLATLTLPYTLPVKFSEICPTEMKEEEHITKDALNYRFSTIHANPPGIETSHPAMVKTRFGEGTVIWSAVPIERADRFQHREIFANIIKYLAGDHFEFGASAPETLECIMFNAPEYRQKLLGLIETRQSFHIPDTYDIDIWIKSDTEPVKVMNLPEENVIPFLFEDGKVKLHFDKINIFKMIAIQYEALS